MTVLNPGSLGKKGANGVVRLKPGTVLPADGSPQGTMVLRGHEAEVGFYLQFVFLMKLLRTRALIRCSLVNGTQPKRPY